MGPVQLIANRGEVAGAKVGCESERYQSYGGPGKKSARQGNLRVRPPNMLSVRSHVVREEALPSQGLTGLALEFLRDGINKAESI